MSSASVPAPAQASSAKAEAGQGGCPEAITLYTAQSQAVLDALERDGVSRVKREYIQQKYGDEAWVFQQAYSFFFQHAQEIVPAPSGAESGIWCYCDVRWAASGAGCSVLTLRVPRDQVVLFDLRVWNRMLNLQYVGTDEADEQAFEQRMARMGIRNPAEAFSTAFYPTVKREILDSWHRLFDSAKGCPAEYLEAGLWEIRSEWVMGT